MCALCGPAWEHVQNTLYLYGGALPYTCDIDRRALRGLLADGGPGSPAGGL